MSSLIFKEVAFCMAWNKPLFILLYCTKFMSFLPYSFSNGEESDWNQPLSVGYHGRRSSRLCLLGEIFGRTVSVRFSRSLYVCLFVCFLFNCSPSGTGYHSRRSSRLLGEILGWIVSVRSERVTLCLFISCLFVTGTGDRGRRSSRLLEEILGWIVSVR